MSTCTKCGEKYSWEEVAEWQSEHEDFCSHPFICPDCYDRFQRQDLEGQLEECLKS